VFGAAAGIFFIAYFFFEVPSNVALTGSARARLVDRLGRVAY
jgi:hypothetical protein